MTAPNSLYGHYAGFVTRAVAFTVDLVIIIVFHAGVTAIVQLIVGAFRLGDFTPTLVGIFLTIFFVLFSFLYYALFWMLAGQTPGKRLMGARVVRTNGQPVTLGVAFLRWIGYFISAILFLGFFWVLLDARRQGWHDKIAGTFVVYASDTKNPAEDLIALRERLKRGRISRRGGSTP